MRLKQAGDVDIKINNKTLLKFRNEMGEQLENILNLINPDNLSHVQGVNYQIKLLTFVKN